MKGNLVSPPNKGWKNQKWHLAPRCSCDPLEATGVDGQCLSLPGQPQADNAICSASPENTRSFHHQRSPSEARSPRHSFGKAISTVRPGDHSSWLP